MGFGLGMMHHLDPIDSARHTLLKKCSMDPKKRHHQPRIKKSFHGWLQFVCMAVGDDAAVIVGMCVSQSAHHKSTL